MTPQAVEVLDLGGGVGRIACLECGGSGRWGFMAPEIPEDDCVDCKGTGLRHVAYWPNIEETSMPNTTTIATGSDWLDPAGEIAHRSFKADLKCEPSGPAGRSYVYRIPGWDADAYDRGRPEYSHQRFGNTQPRGDGDGQHAYSYSEVPAQDEGLDW